MNHSSKATGFPSKGVQGHEEHQSTPVIIAILLGAVLFVVLIVCGVCLIVRRRRTGTWCTRECIKRALTDTPNTNMKDSYDFGDEEIATGVRLPRRKARHKHAAQEYTTESPHQNISRTNEMHVEETTCLAEEDDDTSVETGDYEDYTEMEPEYESGSDDYERYSCDDATSETLKSDDDDLDYLKPEGFDKGAARLTQRSLKYRRGSEASNGSNLRQKVNARASREKVDQKNGTGSERNSGRRTKFGARTSQESTIGKAELSCSNVEASHMSNVSTGRTAQSRYKPQFNQLNNPGSSDKADRELKSDEKVEDLKSGAKERKCLANREVKSGKILLKQDAEFLKNISDFHQKGRPMLTPKPRLKPKPVKRTQGPQADKSPGPRKTGKNSLGIANTEEENDSHLMATSRAAGPTEWKSKVYDGTVKERYNKMTSQVKPRAPRPSLAYERFDAEPEDSYETCLP